MKLIMLGCWGGYFYKDGGIISFLLIGENNFYLLIDVGSCLINELEKEISLLDLDVVIISYYYLDYVVDLGVLYYYCLLYFKDKWEFKVLLVYGYNEDDYEFFKLILFNVV